MEKIQELAKKGKLSKSLIADKEFVNKAKEIFKSQKIDMDDEKLAQIMNEIEIQFKSGNVLDDKELKQVSGGVSEKTIARRVLKTTTMVVGAVIGGKYVGPSVASPAGMTIVGVTGGVTGGILAGAPGVIFVGAAGAELGRIGGEIVGQVAGAPIGGYIGYKLGNLICDKLGLNEQIEKS